MFHMPEAAAWEDHTAIRESYKPHRPASAAE